MDEATVQKAVIEYFHGEDAIFYVDPGSDQSYEVVRKRCRELPDCAINDSIRIGSKIPDIVGMTAQKEIFAVETKGEANLRKGIGQATDYRRGVHKAYLAAEATKLARFEQTAHAAGLGTIPVDADGVLRDLHVFEKIGEKNGADVFTYVGEYEYQDHYWEKAEDDHGEMREAIRFKLIPKNE